MTDKSVTVSVIIPTYNRAHLVGRAIRSVLNQTYQDFEIIVVDDCSTDNTEEIVKGFNDHRIRYMRHDRNRGGSAARNTGIKASQGKYIAFLDSDDEWLPEKLEKQIEKAVCFGEEVGLIYAGEKVIEAETGHCIAEKVPSLEGDVYSLLLEGDFIGSCSSVFVSKKAIESIGGFDEQLVSRQDWDCWLRVAKNYKIACVKAIMVLRYVGQSQISGKLSRIVEGTKRVIDKHHHSAKYKKLYGRQLGMVACMELNIDRLSGWKTAIMALKAYPFQPKLYFALLTSILGKKIYSAVYISWKRMRKDIYIGKAKLQ